MDHGAMSRQQGRLLEDMRIVSAYARDHPDEWADVAWDNEPCVRIVVRFADHLDKHRAALAGLVAHPVRVEVAYAHHTDARLSQVQEEIRAAGYWQRGLRTSVTSDNQVHLALVASAADVAEELHRRYGDVVALTVGALPYPPTAVPAVVSDPPVTDGSLPVRLALVLDRAIMRAGDDGGGHLHITNLGESPLDLITGILPGWVYRPGADRPASSCTGAMTQQGIIIELGPGGTNSRAPVSFGTASFDPDVGYHLAPGAYEVMTVLQYQLPTAGGRPGGQSCIQSPRVPLTLS